MKNVKYDFDDIIIEPEAISEIESRSEVNCKDENNMLPIFASPMLDVVSEYNVNIFKENGIYPIMPRSKHIFQTGSDIVWRAIGLDEVDEIMLTDYTQHVLIDIANGHMRKLINTVKELKTKFGNKLVLMVGNVGNPYTYKHLAEAGADYVRVGIGSGGVCLTSQQTAIGAPMASLIKECKELKTDYNLKCKIIADGGIKKYSDAIKALALGADYIMLGSILNKALESAGDTYKENKKYDSWTEPGEKVNQFDPMTYEMFKNGTNFFKKLRGMSTKDVQKELGREKLKTSEGIIKIHKVEYTLEKWVENFEDYLKSSMSYTNSRTLNDFIGNVKINMITQNSLKRFEK